MKVSATIGEFEVRELSLFVTGLACLLIAAPAAAQQKPQMIGDWMLNIEADRFSDSAANVIAMTANPTGEFIAVRCLQKQISIALGGIRYKTGDRFLIKFRADKNEVFDSDAFAISEFVLQIDTNPEMVREMLAAKEYAVRVIGVASYDYIFRAGRGASRALGEVIKACPLDGKAK